MQNLQVHFSHLLLQTKLTKQVVDGCEPLDRILMKPGATWLATPFETLKEDSGSAQTFRTFQSYPMVGYRTISFFSLTC